LAIFTATKMAGAVAKLEGFGLPISVNSRRHTPKGEQKCTSVLDFRHIKGSLQLGGVQWTSPPSITHSFDSLHIGGNANLLEARETTRKEEARKDAAEWVTRCA
jgi:hypothetical protein